MNKKCLAVLLTLLFCAFGSFAKPPTLTAHYIGDLRWQLDNGWVIYRDLDIETQSPFEFRWAKTQVLTDRLELADHWQGDEYLRLFFYGTKRGDLCGMPRSVFALVQDVDSDLQQGVIIRGAQSLQTSNCATDSRRYVRFDTPAQYQRDVAKRFWDAKMPVMLHNMIIVLGIAVILVLGASVLSKLIRSVVNRKP
uniref:hypothetical protein n=1 Tax=Thaumasiovibrio occultus TaxID=1891184 RepID=UPI000B35E352|nr:hypothetical protein [Thaumasiovibrio occultus]